MRLTCQQDELSRALQLVARGVAQRSTLPILTGILLTAEEGKLWARGTDLEVAVECVLPAAVNTPGTVVVSGKTITEFAKRLPPGQLEVAVDEANKSVRVDSAKASIQLPMMPSEEFPSLPAPSEGAEIRLPAAQLREMIRQTIFATLSEDSRPFLSSILWDLQHDRLRLVATDINRLAMRETEGGITHPTRALIPVRALREVTAIFSGDAEEEVAVLIGGKQAFFSASGVSFSTRLVEAEFPQYEQVIPKSFVAEMVVNREALAAALERAALVTDTVKMTISGGMLYLRADDAAVGQTFEELGVMATGDELQIVFSPQYLQDFLRVVSAERVRFSFTGPTDRAMLKTVEGDGYQYIVMPYQVAV
ncbi:MAG: DNA polymerase III subunit beta [Patescibacteria group bacterium]